MLHRCSLALMLGCLWGGTHRRVQPARDASVVFALLCYHLLIPIRPAAIGSMDARRSMHDQFGRVYMDGLAAAGIRGLLVCFRNYGVLIYILDSADQWHLPHLVSWWMGQGKLVLVHEAVGRWAATPAGDHQSEHMSWRCYTAVIDAGV